MSGSKLNRSTKNLHAPGQSRRVPGQPRRVAIVGSRDWPDLRVAVHEVQLFVWKLARKYPGVAVVSGWGRCVDQTAEREAHLRGLKVYSYRPEKASHPNGAELFAVRLVILHPSGRRLERVLPKRFLTFTDAAFGRNAWIVRAGDPVVAFHNGYSGGTKNAVQEAIRLGRSVHLQPVPVSS